MHSKLKDAKPMATVNDFQQKNPKPSVTPNPAPQSHGLAFRGLGLAAPSTLTPERWSTSSTSGTSIASGGQCLGPETAALRGTFAGAAPPEALRGERQSTTGFRLSMQDVLG